MGKARSVKENGGLVDRPWPRVGTRSGAGAARGRTTDSGGIQPGSRGVEIERSHSTRVHEIASLNIARLSSGKDSRTPTISPPLLRGRKRGGRGFLIVLVVD